jgi:site-specific DNA-methyltransferase (cytosine-N4-specific)
MTPFYADEQVTLHLGDALDVLRTLPDGAAGCIVTSPPYYRLRDYGTPGQYGLETTPAAYVEHLRTVFAEARRVLADDGTLWLNLGDSYSATPSGPAGRTSALLNHRSSRTAEQQAKAAKVSDRPAKNLLGIPWRVAFALQDDGWILRSDIVWHKPNPMPESIKDRLTRAHEMLFLLVKRPRYWFDADAIHEDSDPGQEAHNARYRRAYAAFDSRVASTGQPGKTNNIGIHSRLGARSGRNARDVWSISQTPNPQAHFATFPTEIPLRAIKAGCRPGGTVLDPFSGSGTTGAAARQLGRKYIGIDLSADYHRLAVDRFQQAVLDEPDPEPEPPEPAATFAQDSLDPLGGI